jgi:hypothetical protein
MQDSDFIRREQARLDVTETLEDVFGPEYDTRLKEAQERQRRLERLRKIANM